MDSDTEDNAAPLCSNCHTLYGGNPDLRKEIKARRDNWYGRCVNQYSLVANEDIEAILEHVRSQPVETQAIDIENKVSVQPTQDSLVTDQNLQRQQIYELIIPEDLQVGTGIGTLDQWKFAFNSTKPRIVIYSNGIIGIGSDDAVTSNRSPVECISNCSVECEIRILEDGGDSSRWAGMRVRGLYDDFRLGYLTYLRGKGQSSFIVRKKSLQVLR